MMSESGGVLSLFSLSFSSCAAGSTHGACCEPRELTSSVPQIAGSPDLVLQNAQGHFAIFVFGETAVDPGLSFAGNGAPGCYMHTSGNLRCCTQPVTAESASCSMPMLLTSAARSQCRLQLIHSTTWSASQRRAASSHAAPFER